MDIKQNDYLQIFLEGDTIILKKGQLSCVLCGESDDLVDFREKKVCRKCMAELSAMQ